MKKLIYQQAKYYNISKASARQIIQPIGYHNLYSTNRQQEAFDDGEAINLQNKSQYTINIVYDSPIVKSISYRTNPMSAQTLIQQNLKISQLQRKNEYLSAACLQFMRKQTNQSLIVTMSKHYFPVQDKQIENDRKSLVEFSQLIYHPGFDIFQIEDYAVSKFFILVQNSNLQRIDFLHDAANRKLLNEQVQITRIIHDQQRASKQSKQSEYKCLNSMKQYQGPNNFAALRQILDLIREINEQNTKLDPFYDGVHFYFADYSLLMAKCISLPLLKRQNSHLPVLHYYLLMLTGLLANSQSALIRFQGTFQHKTIQFLFILKLIFNGKITIIKTLGSNLFLPYSYVFCENYDKSRGKVIQKYLIMNFGLLYGQTGKGTDGLIQLFSNIQGQKQQKIQQENRQNNLYNDTIIPSLVSLRKLKKGQQYLHIKEQNLLIDPKKIVKDDLPNSISRYNDTVIYRGLQLNARNFKQFPKTLFYPNKSFIEQKLKGKLCKDIRDIIQKIEEPKITINQFDDKEKKCSEKSDNLPQKVVKQADTTILSMFSSVKQFQSGSVKKKQTDKHKSKKRQQASLYSSKQHKATKNTLQQFLQKCKNQKQDKSKHKSKSKRQK